MKILNLKFEEKRLLTKLQPDSIDSTMPAVNAAQFKLPVEEE